MTQRFPLRIRMMLLFCAVVGVLLASTFFGFYVLFARELESQFNCRLLKAGNPIVAGLASNAIDPRDIYELNVPDEYFELLDSSGQVLQRSKNLQGQTLSLGGRVDVSREVYRTVEDGERGRERVVLIPFQSPQGHRLLALAMPARRNDSVLMGFQRLIMWLLPMSLLVTASISVWYVGRSLRPVTELTCQATRMMELIERSPRGAAAAWTHTLDIPLLVTHSRDELARLASTFNQLFGRVDVALQQSRQFVADASHQLRTPLAVLRGETELLLSKPRTTEEYEETVRVMDGELRTLTRILEGLFTLSMADSGQLRLTREALYLNEVIEQACARIALPARAKGIRIHCNTTQDLPCFGDEALLQELCLIFLDNAIKYSPSDTQIWVELEQVGSQATITFRDQGYGIPSEHLPHIFERFYRGSHYSSNESRSGGLGLAIAQAIVAAHDGTITCESTIGSHTTFTVTLPYSAQPIDTIDGAEPQTVFTTTTPDNAHSVAVVQRA
jgi:two-component system OmpR family sensor kinase